MKLFKKNKKPSVIAISRNKATDIKEVHLFRLFEPKQKFKSKRKVFKAMRQVDMIAALAQRENHVYLKT